MHVLVPVDGSRPSEEALRYAFEQFADDELTALYVKDPIDGSTAWGQASADDWMAAAEEHAEKILRNAEDLAAEAGVQIRTDTVLGRPSRAIIEYVDEHGVDHVVVGSHGRDGVSRVLLGSVAEVVVRRSTVPVTVVRARED